MIGYDRWKTTDPNECDMFGDGCDVCHGQMEIDDSSRDAIEAHCVDCGWKFVSVNDYGL